MKTVFRHILTLGFILGIIFFSVDSYMGRMSAYGKYEYDASEMPLLSLSLRAIDSGETPYLIALAKDKMFGKGNNDKPSSEEEKASDVADAENTGDTEQTADNSEAENNEQQGQAAEEANAGATDQTIEETDNDGADEGNVAATEVPAEEAEVPVEEQPAEEVPEEEVYVMTSVDDDYFCDALFIGDSRTVGLSEYCQELIDRSTFYAKVSMTIYGFDKIEFVEVPVLPQDPAAESTEGTESGENIEDAGSQADTNVLPAEEAPADNSVTPEDIPTETVTIEEALSRKQFGKIYVMLGINELGSGTTETFCAKYAEVLAKIREKQPDAIIYIQGIMHVTSQKSSKDKVFKNETINERNEGLKALADGEHIFYIDMNEATDDENGALNSELSFDSVHLKAKSYALWYDYLKNHAYVKMKVSEIPSETPEAVSEEATINE